MPANDLPPDVPAGAMGTAPGKAAPMSVTPSLFERLISIVRPEPQPHPMETVAQREQELDALQYKSSHGN